MVTSCKAFFLAANMFESKMRMTPGAFVNANYSPKGFGQIRGHVYKK
jgi:hypothetical protein